MTEYEIRISRHDFGWSRFRDSHGRTMTKERIGGLGIRCEFTPPESGCAYGIAWYINDAQSVHPGDLAGQGILRRVT